MRYWWAIPIGAALALLITSRVTRASATGRPQHFAPGAPETVQLFEQAAQVAGLPRDWANRDSLHRLMDRESSGWVGRPNYRFSYVRGLDGIHHPSQADRWPSEIWDRLKAGQWSYFTSNQVRRTDRRLSTAVGLGQLLSDKWDLMPGGAQGIGNPVAEAVGFMRYIRNRYGDPDRAYRFHRLPMCEEENEQYIRSLSGFGPRVDAAFELGCKHHEGY